MNTMLCAAMPTPTCAERRQCRPIPDGHDPRRHGWHMALHDKTDRHCDRPAEGWRHLRADSAGSVGWDAAADAGRGNRTDQRRCSDNGRFPDHRIYRAARHRSAARRALALHHATARSGISLICKRYFEKSYNYATLPGAAVGGGSNGLLFNTPGSAVGLWIEPSAIKSPPCAAATFTSYDGAGAPGKISVFNGSAWVNASGWLSGRLRDRDGFFPGYGQQCLSPVHWLRLHRRCEVLMADYRDHQDRYRDANWWTAHSSRTIRPTATAQNMTGGSPMAACLIPMCHPTFRHRGPTADQEAARANQSAPDDGVRRRRSRACLMRAASARDRRSRCPRVRSTRQPRNRSLPTRRRRSTSIMMVIPTRLRLSTSTTTGSNRLWRATTKLIAAAALRQARSRTSRHDLQERCRVSAQHDQQKRWQHPANDARPPQRHD